MHLLGRAHRLCIGINLANAALSLVLGAVVEYGLRLFETDERDVKYMYDFQTSHSKLDSLFGRLWKGSIRRKSGFFVAPLSEAEEKVAVNSARNQQPPQT